MVGLSLEFPQDFFEEEVRCGYLVDKRMKEIWAVELDLLHKLLEVCEKHNIRIYAEGGTLLGAIRHQGMIPWDDDVDMMMYREDYDHLCEVAQYEFDEPYFFQTEYSDPGSIRGHAQLRNSQTTAILSSEKDSAKFNQGIFIDIFPLDAVIEDERLLKKQEKDAKRWKTIMWKLSGYSYRYQNSQSGMKRILKEAIYRVVNCMIRSLRIEQWAHRKYERVCQRFNDKDTERVSTLTFDFGNEKLFIRKSDLQSIREVPFEFMSIPICEGYDSVLRRYYGNYEEYVVGTNMHGFVLFDVERSYREYLGQ